MFGQDVPGQKRRRPHAVALIDDLYSLGVPLALLSNAPVTFARLVREVLAAAGLASPIAVAQVVRVTEYGTSAIVIVTARRSTDELLGCIVHARRRARPCDLAGASAGCAASPLLEPSLRAEISSPGAWLRQGRVCVARTRDQRG